MQPLDYNPRFVLEMSDRLEHGKLHRRPGQIVTAEGSFTAVDSNPRKMDESEKRAERLKAMRMEASQSELSSRSIPPSSPIPLASPLLESPGPPMAEKSPDIVRFDYYTDPLSAFFCNKRRNMGHNAEDFFSPHNNSSSPLGQISPSLSVRPRSPAIPRSPVVEQRQYMMPHSNMTPCTWRNMIGVVSPFAGPRGVSVFGPLAGNLSGGWPSSGTRGGDLSPAYGGGSSPSSGVDLGKRNDTHGISPTVGAEAGKGTSPRLISPNTSVCSGRRFSPRGSCSVGLGRGKGKGRRLHHSISAREKPELFYKRSMVEDPWMFLKPVIGSLLGPVADPFTSDSEKSWIPLSVRVKARGSDSLRLFSQSSLAECLDDSLEEALQNGMKS